MADNDTLPTFTIDYRWTLHLARDTRAARGQDPTDNGDRTAGWVITCRDQTGATAFISGKTGTLEDVSARTVHTLTDAHGPAIAGRIRHTIAGSAAEFRDAVGAAVQQRLAHAVKRPEKPAWAGGQAG